jgi:hypothetical protein
MARNYNDPTWVYVELASGILYVFPSRLKDSLRDNLGQILTSTLTSINKVVVGSQSPKPNRAVKAFPTGTESSFCAHSKIPTLKADDWEIRRSKTRNFALTTQNATAYKVTVNGLNYAWQSANLPAGVSFPPNYPDPREPVDANDTNLVWGADFPKPPTFSIKTGGNRISSFLDPSKISAAKTAGVQTGGGITTLDVFQQLYV